MLDRLKQYIDFKGLTVAAIEKAANMSNGALAKPIRNHTSIGCDKLENILMGCPDLDLTWLITGQGNMIKGEGASVHNEVPSIPLSIENKLLQDMVTQKEAKLLEQAKEIGRLEQRIKELTQRLEKTAGGASTGDTANVG